MTKKHFCALASIIADRRSEMPLGEPTNPIDRGWELCRKALARDIAIYCGGNNPAFSRDKFMKACKVEGD